MKLELYLREVKLRTKSWSQCLRVKSSKFWRQAPDSTSLEARFKEMRAISHVKQRSSVIGQNNNLMKDFQTLTATRQRSLFDVQWHIRTKRKRGSLSQRYPITFHRRFCRYVLWRVASWMSARCRVRVEEGRKETVPIGTYMSLLTAAAFYWASASYFKCDRFCPIQSVVCL